MPRLIVGGLPQSMYRRHKKYRPSAPGWDVVVVASRKERADLQTCWSEIQTIADDCDHDGAHIFAFHAKPEERGEFHQQIYGRHRLVWLEPSDLKVWGTGEFDTRLNSLVSFEQEWRNEIRPADVRAALVLPEHVFVANDQVMVLWKRAQVVSAMRDSIPTIVRVRDQFESAHRRGSNWIDARTLVFAASRDLHGRIPNARRWKYTFAVPDGFHYDVRKRDGRAFTMTDCIGASRSYAEYTNVDCQGYVRGGK